MTTEQYHCLDSACGYEFELPKPQPTACLKCGHLYVKWVNYDESRFFPERFA